MRHTLELVARENGNLLEIILKDTHPCENQPEGCDHRAQIGRE